MNSNAEILLVRSDGAFILQVRDDKPGIANPGMVSSFGGRIEDGETPKQAAIREINEETNLQLTEADLKMYRRCIKTKKEHGEDWEVHYFVAQGISDEDLEVYEGSGYTVIHNREELSNTHTSKLLKKVLNDHYDGFRSFIFFKDMPDDIYAQMVDDYYQSITKGKSLSKFSSPVAVACAGLVASGKSTITSPLAESINAVQVSSDLIRERIFQAGYNFQTVRKFARDIIAHLQNEKYDIFLDFNISTNMDILDNLQESGYKIFVVHANPPLSFIENKILTGNMKHELSFFPKDEFLYESLLGWKDDHLVLAPLLREKYGFWREVDTSRSDLCEAIANMVDDFQLELSET